MRTFIEFLMITFLTIIIFAQSQSEKKIKFASLAPQSLCLTPKTTEKPSTSSDDLIEKIAKKIDFYLDMGYFILHKQSKKYKDDIISRMHFIERNNLWDMIEIDDYPDLVFKIYHSWIDIEKVEKEHIVENATIETIKHNGLSISSINGFGPYKLFSYKTLFAKKRLLKVQYKSSIELPSLKNQPVQPTLTSSRKSNRKHIDISITNSSDLKKIRTYGYQDKIHEIPSRMLDIIEASLETIISSKLDFDNQSIKFLNIFGKTFTQFAEKENITDYRINLLKNNNGISLLLLEYNGINFALDPTNILSSDRRELGFEIYTANSISELESALSIQYDRSSWGIAYQRSYDIINSPWHSSEFIESSIENITLKIEKLELIIRELIIDKMEINSKPDINQAIWEYLNKFEEKMGENAKNIMQSEIKELQEDLRISIKTLENIKAARKINPEIFRQILRMRQDSKNNDKIKAVVNVCVGKQTAGGVFGNALNICEAIAATLHDIRVNFINYNPELTSQDYFKIEKLNPKINYFPINSNKESKESTELTQLHDESDLVIVMGGGMGKIIPAEKDGFVLLETIFTEYIDETNLKDAEEAFNLYLRGHNNLETPLGTLPLNRALKNRREQRDKLSKDDIVRARRKWLDENLSQGLNGKREKLLELSAQEKWEPESCVWTSAYFQDKINFLQEIEKICNSESDLSEIFDDDGNQLIINAVPGRYLFPNLLTPKELTELGCKVIDENGILHEPSGKTAPVTIILHNQIPHDNFLELVCELDGTLMRDDDNQHWLDFPEIVTGEGSFHERISAGRIILHDGYDCGLHRKRQFLTIMIVRMLAMNPTNEYMTWEELEKMAEPILDDLLLGHHANRRFNRAGLESWTKEAREFSESIFKYNMIDHIIDVIRKHKNDKTILHLPQNEKNGLRSA